MKNQIIIFLVLASFSGFGQIIRTLPLVTNTADSMKPVSIYQKAAIVQRLQTVTSITALQAFTDSPICQFDGSTWNKISGNVASNGGAYAGTIINVSTLFYWQRSVNNYINVKWFGAVGNGGTDDTQAIQAALDLPSVCTIYFPIGIYKVTSQLEYCLKISVNKNLVGENIRNSVIRADNCGNNTCILKIAITNNEGLTDVRGSNYSNLNMFFNGGGKDCIVIKDCMSLFNAQLEKLQLAGNSVNGGYSISVQQNGFAFSTITNCTLSEGVLFNNVADGNRIVNNVIFGNQVGLDLNVIDGSYQTLIRGNTIVNRDGGITIRNGSQIKIENNQFEFSQSNVGASTSPYKHTIWIQGILRQSFAIDILGNNFGGGTNLNNSIVIDNATDTHISRNRFNAVTNVDVLLNSTSQYNYLHFDNYTTGGTRRTDKFRLLVTDAGEGNYGILKQTSAASTGGYNAGTTYYKDPVTEEVVLNESNGGTTSTSTVLITMPQGFKPKTFYYLPCGTSAGMTTVLTNPTSGNITLNQASPSNASVGEGLRFTAKRGA